MPNTIHLKCLECHIKVANHLIHLVQQYKLNSPQTKKKKKSQAAYFLMRFPC